jgi:pimeloyl-ACP methyl ester carboxylesterase
VSASQEDIELHGQHMRVRTHGAGPAILLLHGITHSSATWDAIIAELAGRFTVIAPDLLGHGLSAKPPGDYSLGEYASSLRDLLIVLGHSRVTLVGHSLGGGVAMQFVYQFPEMCERLVLVSSGGLGRELNPLLRLPTLPGSEWLMAVLCSAGVSNLLVATGHALGRAGARSGTDLREVWRGYRSLSDPGARQAFLHTLRGLIDLRGQRASARSRLYLAENLPTLIVWGARDRLIPVEHAHAAHAAMVGSRLEIFAEAGHFPHLDEPARFVSVLVEFIRSSEAAHIDALHFARLAQRRSGRPVALPAEADALETSARPTL